MLSRYEEELSHLTNKVEKLTEIIEQLMVASEILQSEGELKAYKIFGIEASTSLTMSIIGIYISFVGFIVSIYYSNSQVAQDLTNF